MVIDNFNLTFLRHIWNHNKYHFLNSNLFQSKFSLVIIIEKELTGQIPLSSTFLLIW